MHATLELHHDIIDLLPQSDVAHGTYSYSEQ